MFKVDIPLSTKEQAAIDRRRQQEAARRERVLDAKNRTMGMDYGSLADQIADRKAQESDSLLRSEIQGAELNRQDRILQMLDHRQREDIRQLNKATVDFRKEHQGAALSDTADLNDPDAKKKEIPTRVGDDDPRCGPSSVQMFQGEDLSRAAREELQKQQMRTWVRGAVAEKEVIQGREASDRRLEAMQSKAAGDYVAQCFEQEAEVRADGRYKNRDENFALVLEKADRIAAEAEAAQRANYVEIMTEVSFGVTAERVQLNPYTGKPISTSFRGFEPEQVAEVRSAQERQRQEVAGARAAERAAEAEAARVQALHVRATLLMEREQNRQLAALRKQNQSFNATLGRTQQDVAFKNNAIGAGFYDQFGTSSR